MQPFKPFARYSFLLVLLFSLAACGGQAAPTDTPAPEATSAPPTAEPTETMVSNEVSVTDQELGEGNTVTIPVVVSDGPGWLVIHADADGSPGPVIGHTAVSAGASADVFVEIDPTLATETLYAMLHVDAGTAGEYEFPGDDVPATDAEGNVVTPSFELTGGLPVNNSVSVTDQELGEGNTVTIPVVVSDGPGWLVIHADADGSPGPVIGHTQVSAGASADVMVEIDPSMATETLYAMLHVDAGTVGEYEFPGDDVPATDAEGNVVTPSFQLTGGTSEASTVLVGGNDELGDFLVAANGMTLYIFTVDEPGKSNCYDDCATAWPPLLVEEGQTPTAGEGVTGELGTTTRDDGTVQATYNDEPLYFYAPDQEPGDATGQNVGDVWFVVEP